MKTNINLMEVPIGQVKPNGWNPNTQSEFIFKKQRQSLQDEGQVLPVLVREIGNDTYEIVDGEHRWRAANEEGSTIIAINNLGKMSDAKAKMLGQKINRINGVDDPARLKDLYKGLLDDVEKEFIIDQLPITELQFEEAIKDLDLDFSEMPSDSRSGGEGKGEDEFVRLSLSVPKWLKDQFDEEMERFKKLLYPNENPKNVSEVMPLQAMIACCARTEDDDIKGVTL